MDYLELAAKGSIFLGCSMLIGVALYLARGWWLERIEHKEREAAMQQENDEYAGDQQQALLQHIDEYDGLRESLLSHIEELLKKVDK